MLFRSYPNWRRRWNVGLITCGCGVWRHTAKHSAHVRVQWRLTQLTDKVPTMHREGQVVVAEVVDQQCTGRQVSVWWFDGLTFSLATWNRGRAEVCGLRHVCVWMQERWKVRARVCTCLHQSWSTNTFFCNLHSEWDLLCTSNVDHSSFQTKDFVYIGAFLGIHHCYLPCKCGWHTLEKRLKETTVIFITWCVPMMKPHIWIMVLSQEDSDDRMEDKQRISQCCTNFVCRDKLDFLGCGSTDILFSEKKAETHDALEVVKSTMAQSMCFTFY